MRGTCSGPELSNLHQAVPRFRRRAVQPASYWRIAARCRRAADSGSHDTSRAAQDRRRQGSSSSVPPENAAGRRNRRRQEGKRENRETAGTPTSAVAVVGSRRRRRRASRLSMLGSLGVTRLTPLPLSKQMYVSKHGPSRWSLAGRRRRHAIPARADVPANRVDACRRARPATGTRRSRIVGNAPDVRQRSRRAARGCISQRTLAALLISLSA